MIPGPDRIVACPLCQAHARHGTILSGNTFGARVWTDGKMIAPMLPRPPAVVRCHHCAACYWLEDARQISLEHPGMERPEVPPEGSAVPEVREPTEEEYYRAIDEGLGGKAPRERLLRILCWWRSNDVFRDAPGVETPSIATTPERRRANLEALAELLDEAHEDDRIMKAELLRELGEFESAIRLLQAMSEPYVRAADRIRSLCETRDAVVRALESHG
jgi:hypothetical protein